MGKTRFSRQLWVVFLLSAALFAAPCAGRTITLDANGTGEYPTIQAGIDDSNNGDVIVLCPGRYTGPGNREIDFKGKAITVRSTDPNDPNIVATTIIDCNDMSRGFYFHSYEDANSVLAGLTVANGYPGSRANGGGIYCYQSSPLITNCTFRENRFKLGGCGGGNGGGMYNLQSNPTLIDCAFVGNSAYYSGGGMCNSQSSPTLINCTFVGNSAYGCGGGMCNSLSSPTLIKCTFRRNRAKAEGGGLRDDWGTTTVSDCVFSGNSAGMGGAVYILGEGDIQLANSIFAGNTATDTGGGLWLGSGSGDPSLTNCVLVANRSLSNEGSQILYLGCSTLTVTTCIFWNDSSTESNAISLYAGRCNSMITISHSDIRGGLAAVYVHEHCQLNWDPGNIDTDPCFSDAGYWDPNGTPDNANDDFWVDGDYHLKSQAGRWAANEGRWIKDDVTSLCIDAGDPMVPIMHEPFPNGGRINIGAYGGTGEASKSYFGNTPCEVILCGDINGDCIIDFMDFQIMGLHWCEDNNP
jgi:hypothetical protein